MEKTVFIFSGRVEAPRCQAKSKRTKVQCGLAAGRGKRVCRFHGAGSTGPKTQKGRAKCAQARTIHGTDTREIRKASRAKMREIQALYDSLPWFSKSR